MSGIETMVRTELSADGSSYYLAQGQDVDELMQRIEDAAGSGGRFVRFTVVGNRTVNLLVTPATRAVVSVETVQYDARDDGDEGAPYGGLYDL